MINAGKVVKRYLVARSELDSFVRTHLPRGTVVVLTTKWNLKDLEKNVNIIEANAPHLWSVVERYYTDPEYVSLVNRTGIRTCFRVDALTIATSLEHVWPPAIRELARTHSHRAP